MIIGSVLAAIVIPIVVCVILTIQVFSLKRQLREVEAARDTLMETMADGSFHLDEEEFFKEKRADVLVIATQDRDHVRQCIRALELGYDVLLEKPISPNIAECIDIWQLANKMKRKTHPKE